MNALVSSGRMNIYLNTCWRDKEEFGDSDYSAQGCRLEGELGNSS